MIVYRISSYQIQESLRESTAVWYKLEIKLEMKFIDLIAYRISSYQIHERLREIQPESGINYTLNITLTSSLVV